MVIGQVMEPDETVARIRMIRRNGKMRHGYDIALADEGVLPRAKTACWDLCLG